MTAKSLALGLAVLLAACTTTTVSDDRSAGTGNTLSERVKQISRGTTWRQVTTIPAQFDTQHPQGMVKIGDTLYISSVEITTPTKRFAQPQGDHDRDTGTGVGHLYKVDMN